MNLLCGSYAALEFADHAAVQQMVRQFTQLAQVVVETTGTARVRAEVQRLFRHHSVCDLITSRRRTDRSRPSTIKTCHSHHSRARH